MKYKVYLDSFIFGQMLLHYLTLMLNAKLLKTGCSRLRIMIASLVGAIMELLIFLPLPFPVLYRIPFVFFLSGSIMLFISFRVKGFRANMIMISGYFIITLLMEGFCIFVNGYIKPLLFDCFSFHNGIIHFLLYIFVVLFYYFLHFIIKKLFGKRKKLVAVTCFDGQKEVSTVALLDTGNCVKVNQKGVIMADEALFKDRGLTSAGEVNFRAFQGEMTIRPYYILNQLKIHTEYGERVYKDVCFIQIPSSDWTDRKFQMILPSEEEL